MADEEHTHTIGSNVATALVASGRHGVLIDEARLTVECAEPGCSWKSEPVVVDVSYPLRFHQIHAKQTHEPAAQAAAGPRLWRPPGSNGAHS